MTPFELGFITALRCIELLQDSLRAEAEDIMKPDETIVAEHAIVFMDSRGRLTWINKKSGEV